VNDPESNPGAAEPRSTARRTAGARGGEELLALAQEAGGLGIFEWEPQAGTVRLSPKLRTLYGLAEFDGRFESWIRQVFREDVLRLSNAFDTAFTARSTEIVEEFRIVRPGDDAPRWMEMHANISYDARKRPRRLVGVSVDVTDRKRALVQLRAFTETLEERVKARTRELEAENEARRKAEESLRQAQKMEVVGQLTGGIAHDFNNLLTVVMGGLEMIERQLPALPESSATQRIGRARELALEGVKRAAKLTERLLAFARRQPLSPRHVDANEMVAGISDLLHRTLGETIALRIITQSEIWLTHADPNQLENALLNLAINSRDAMPGGGTLTIETRNRVLDEEYTATLTEHLVPGDYVMIAITDSGAGMDAATIEHAFEPFFTTKEVGKGTGLGLSQVYGFVRQSSGHVRIDSETGQGTTVTIYLPRHSGDGEVARQLQRKASTGRSTGGECILVVEDDASLRTYTTAVLRDLAYNVIEAGDAAAALLVLQGRRKIDLLFTDIVMPGGINGRELAKEALVLRPGLKVLFTTGYSGGLSGEQDSSGLPTRVIGKPFTIDTLAARVRGTLDANENR
jgi:signal transduction histidine kinase